MEEKRLNLALPLLPDDRGSLRGLGKGGPPGVEEWGYSQKEKGGSSGVVLDGDTKCKTSVREAILLQINDENN